MIKKILSICAILALCAFIAVVPCFAIQSGWYDGQPIIHLLGAQYRVLFQGSTEDTEDAIVLFDTRGMFWFEEASGYFSNNDTSMIAPDVYVHNDIFIDSDASVVYNDLTLVTDHYSILAGNSFAHTFMQSDYFTLGSDARLGLHLSPIKSGLDDEYFLPPGDIVAGTVHFYVLTVDGDVIDVPYYRDDLVIGGTYDLTSRLDEFFDRNDIQYYWVEYEGWNVVPTFVQDFTMHATMPWTDVRVVDWATDIVYPEVISYEDFNLLSWLGSAIDGFLTTTIFSVGGIDVTLGVIFSVPLTIMILIVFLKKFAGG